MGKPWSQEGGRSASPSAPCSRADYDAELIATADYFTLVRKCGPSRYERYEGDTLDSIRRLGGVMGGRWMIYAVRGQSSCHVENIGG